MAEQLSPRSCHLFKLPPFPPPSSLFMKARPASFGGSRHHRGRGAGPWYAAPCSRRGGAPLPHCLIALTRRRARRIGAETVRHGAWSRATPGTASTTVMIQPAGGARLAQKAGGEQHRLGQGGTFTPPLSPARKGASMRVPRVSEKLSAAWNLYFYMME